MNAQQVVRKMIDLRLIEVASQLHVRPGGAVLECECWDVFANYCTGHDTDEHVFGVLADAETFLLDGAA